MGMEKPLPEFSDPPVVEVALGVQFDPLAELRTPQLGLLWQTFRDRFPRIEEHPPLPSAVETFGARAPSEAGVRVEMMRKPPLPRVWFLNEQGTELIQVQQDRFVHNWRKTGEKDSYPRYKKRIKPMFLDELTAFQKFLQDEKIGELTTNQCELTYVNHIVAGRGWDRHGQLSKVLVLSKDEFTEPFLPEPEELRVNGSFVIRGSKAEPLGRLRFSIEPAMRQADERALFVLTLMARGSPLGTGPEGIQAFLDLGRTYIVRGFAALTTRTMHEIWERTK